MIESCESTVIVGNAALPGEIEAWLGVPAHWWIEPTPLFEQNRVQVWGKDQPFPIDARIDEFWAWGFRNGQSRAMHGVRRAAQWQLLHLPGKQDCSEVYGVKSFELMKRENRYQAAKSQAGATGRIRFSIASQAGRVLLVGGEDAS